MIIILFEAIHPLGDCAVVIQLGNEVNRDTHRKVWAFCSLLEEQPFPGMIEYVPAYTNVTIYYHLPEIAAIADTERHSPYEMVCSLLISLVERIEAPVPGRSRIVEIPVCYGGEFGIDLGHVAECNELTPDEVISIHAQGEYLTYMMGFAPGFPYLGGLSERIATPRRDTPRLNIPPGTVGIAGRQTGVYPLESPGGWQLIGRTPLALFRPHQWPPSYIQMGDIVKFVPISEQEFWQHAEEV